MFHFVVLCGGTGSRLWPKSREKLPKQFLTITNDCTMLQNTLLRIINVIQKLEIGEDNTTFTIICNKEHVHLVELQVQELSIKAPIHIIGEPKGRDSAPAICIAALYNNLNDCTFVLPCDHVFNDDAFVLACQKSIPYLKNSIVTFGIKPTRVECGYGYIQTTETNNTIKFIEKPNYVLAQQFIEEGTYFWNVGIFAFQNKNIVKCFDIFAPDILESCVQTIDDIKKTNNGIMNAVNTIILPDSFLNCRSISMDYAIMEPLCKDTDLFVDKMTIVMDKDSGWNDIGSFAALYDEMSKLTDTDNNVIKGDVVTFETKDCYIESNSSLIATVDVQNLIIVETDDALLVCNKHSAQNVKKIVDELKKKKRDETLFHRTVYRPWGYYKNIEGNDTNGFKVKRISVYPGKRLSLQSHNHRSEHWVIVKGTGKVVLGTEEIILYKNEHIYIPTKMLHRMENIGTELLEFTETQIGEYLGEDDIIRYEDDFGRL